MTFRLHEPDPVFPGRPRGIVGSVRRAETPKAEGARALERDRKFLWGVCYRMTGSAADAEDLVQETFLRALQRPPADPSLPLRPWLTRVSMNLCRDLLRRRRRRGYPGVWLPEPVEAGETDGEADSDTPSAEARYSALESASFAFLFAAEALTPSQRAVLILRDAFDYSSAETASLLDMSEGNVRITLHRARKAMTAYDRGRFTPSPALAATARETVLELIGHLAAQNVEGARKLLSPEAIAYSDGGGVYYAAGVPVRGRERIIKMYSKLARGASSDVRVEIRALNGSPAMVGDDPRPRKPNAPRFVLVFDMGPDGLVRAMFSVLAPDKLGRVFGPSRAVAAGPANPARDGAVAVGSRARALD